MNSFIFMKNKGLFLFNVLMIMIFLSYNVNAKIKDSVITLMDKFENIDNIVKNKYSAAQYKIIKEHLQLKNKKIRIMTYNLLHNLDDAKLPFVYKWPQRLSRIVEYIRYSQPDIICTQELGKVQLSQLADLLLDEYTLCDNSYDDGEVNGIFFRTKRFALESAAAIKVPSFNEKEGQSHPLIRAKFFDKKNKKNFVIYNVHFPYKSADQRFYSANYIKEKIHAKGVNTPIILAGDFNSIAHRLDFFDMPFFDGDYIHTIFSNANFFDVKEKAVLGHLGPIATFTNKLENNNGVPFQGYGVPGIFLDHIYINKKFRALLHAVDPVKVDSYFPSDHMPVIADVIIYD